MPATKKSPAGAKPRATSKKTTGAKTASAKKPQAKAQSANGFDQAREFIAKGAERFREQTAQYGKPLENVRAVAEDANQAIRTSAATAATGARSFNLKALNKVQTDANRFFDYTKTLAKAGSVTEAAEIQRNFVRDEFKAQTAETRELVEMAWQNYRDTVEPFTTRAKDAFAKAGIRTNA
jgi:hypothetical protein